MSVRVVARWGSRPTVRPRGSPLPHDGTRRRLRAAWRWLSGTVLALCLCLATFGQLTARPGEQVLKLFNIHTKESATIVFKRNGAYVPQGLKRLNAFLRDWRREQPSRMDPALFDLIWEVYRQSGSNVAIHVVSGYRSPETNGRLRRRSKGVAKNSLHVRGQALDFYMPDVKLSKLRELGLRFHIGGVGYYPRSGAPFVHLDTGSIRHWPRMSRKQLVSLFPDGKTMHVPSDGKPLGGYALAKAEYDARKGGRRIALASLAPAVGPRRTAPSQTASDPLVIASAPARLPRTSRPVAVAVASYDTAPAPLPRLAPRRPSTAAPVATPVAAREPPRPSLSAAPIRSAFAETGFVPTPLAPAFDFGRPQDWSAPAVPANLAAAMAERDQTRRNASLPIPPTSVVTTIDVSRPLRAQTITTAVLGDGIRRSAPQILAYAPPAIIAGQRRFEAGTASLRGVPLPRANPFRRTSGAGPATRSVAPLPRFKAPGLTLTTLDTHGLRSWIRPGTTRQRAFAVLTMPDIGQVRDLMEMPEFSYGDGFGPRAYPDLRTDRFTRPFGRQPAIVRLGSR